MDYWDLVPATAGAYDHPQFPANDLRSLAWRGLQALAPNITNPATYAPLPPPSMTPTSEGKLPSADRDPRIEGVLSDLVNIALTLAPTPGAGAGLGLARGLPSLVRQSASTAAREAGSLASKSAGLYNPPVKPPRPFAADYPKGATADAAGRLTHDIEGRPLTAEYLAGRNVVGQGEKALSPAELDAIATSLAGRPPQSVAAREIGGDAGQVSWLRPRPHSFRDYQVLINRGLSPRQADRVLGHETGHLISEIAGQIPVTGLNTELRQVYDTLNTGRERTRHLTGPQHLGYRGDDVPRELMAEAIRGYMADPNYLKSVAPKTAARIREFVNSHPTLSKTIQFNALAALIANEIESASLPIPKQSAPIFPQ